MRSTLALLTVTAGVIVPAGAAHAAVGATVSVTGTTAVYQAGPGKSALTTTVSGGLTFSDSLQSITAGAGCTAGTPVVCGGMSRDIRFGDKPDQFFGSGGSAITVHGGGGADSIAAHGLWNIVDGGDGNDSIWENGDSKGSIVGGAGADKIYTFEAASNASGGIGNDLLIGASGAGLASTLTGDDGNDEIVVQAPRGSGTASGGAGADVIVLDTSASATYTADGGDGADTIKGGPGTDTVLGGTGNDVIDVSGDDGNADNVSCGAGRDTVYADASDVIAADCERVLFSTPSLPKVDTARADAAAFIAAAP
jgi:Ca2+-binding RTX toxin-like protein